MATHQESPLFLHKKDVVFVKPAEPTPKNSLSFSTIDNDPNLELICQTIYVYQENITNPSPHLDPASIMKEALSKVLVYYYPLGGKLKKLNNGKLQLTCNADGVPFLEATANCTLSSLNYFDHIDVKIAKLFVLDWPTVDNYGYHPLVFQVTKFSCGGVTIGMGISHSVCDGFGAAQFYQAMTELASGKSEPRVKPVWERERLVGLASEEPIKLPIDKNSLVTSPYWPTSDTDIQHECFTVDGESISRLKMSLVREIENEVQNGISFTTIEALGAYVWRSKFRALKQNPDGKTSFTLAMGIRNIIKPPLPEGYYGNAFGSSHVVLTGQQLNEGPLSNVAKLIKQSKKNASNSDYMWSMLDILETMWQQNMRMESSGASTVLTDWRNLGLVENEDFGWKACVNMVPLPWDMFGYVDLCIFLPPSKMSCSIRGGVMIRVSLPRAAMATFKEEMDALKLRGDNFRI